MNDEVRELITGITDDDLLEAVEEKYNNYPNKEGDIH